jgi:proprotein convertase subtilisin/kexin type 5
MKIRNKMFRTVFYVLSIELVIELCLCNYIGDGYSNRGLSANSTNYKIDNYIEDSNISQGESNVTTTNRKGKIYTNRFAVKLSPDANPDEVAKELGYVNMGRIGSLEDYYIFIGHHLTKRSIEPHDTKHFDDHEHVRWYEQQHVKKRVKRDLVFDLPSASPALTPQKVLMFSDPLFPKQWYFNRGARDGYDMNVAPVWKMGITGKSVVLTILDDGVQADHPDLIKNYDKKASWDINSNDDNPTPQDNGENKHGTRCAGEIAAEANNEYCGVGVAYDAKIGGVRMLDGTVTDDVEAQALGLNPNHIDVYSASWGPDDNGKTVDGPGHLAAQAFINGVRYGRKGRGSIFVWASGNGGKKQDNCNCDGYTNSIYTLSISSATKRGQKPWYLEECSSTLATTYSSGTPTKDENIVTADQSNELADAAREGRKPNPSKFCTQVHTGTSASAPIAAGIVALALEANPELTWRDMQHIVVASSRYEPLKHESGWTLNAKKRWVSHKFGYGLMDAEAMVKQALNWKQTPPQVICRTPVDTKERTIQEDLIVSMNTNACEGTDNAVNYLEHVQARISLKFQPRGNLRITLISPSGTASHLLMSRPRDTDEDTFDKWPFMSVHFWGEDPKGTWKIMIRNENRRRIADQQGTLYSWSLVFYGTTTAPFTEQHTSEAQRVSRRTSDIATYNEDMASNRPGTFIGGAWMIYTAVVMSVLVVAVFVARRRRKPVGPYSPDTVTLISYSD